MELAKVVQDSSLTHPDEQWKMHRNDYERTVLYNPLQNLGHGLRPDNKLGPLYDEFGNADKAKEINDFDVYLWMPHPDRQVSLIRWKKTQLSAAISIFCQEWGIFARIPLWCVNLEVAKVVEEITGTMRWVMDRLVDCRIKPTIPLFECHIYEPSFEHLPSEYVESAMQIKKEIARLVRPALTHFINYKFKIAPFMGVMIQHEDDGPVVEAQWVPEAGRMVLAMSRELKPDGSFGKIEHLDWIDGVAIEDVTNVPLPLFIEGLERTVSPFASPNIAEWFRLAIKGEH